MAAPMRSTDFRSIVEPILNECFDGVYDQRSDEWSTVFREQTGIPRNYHEEPVLYGFGAAPELPDGTPVTYQQGGVLFLQRYVYITAKVKLYSDLRQALHRYGSYFFDTLYAHNRVFYQVRNVGLHDLRGRAFPRDRYIYYREVHIRKLAHTQTEKSDGTEHQHAYHEHPGEYRPLDRKV